MFLRGINMKLYSIGQVSSIVGIPVKTIRYYTDIGLCVPSEIDAETGYRYFSAEDIFRIDLIRCLGHSAGMPLKKIGEYIERCDDTVSLRDYLLEQEAIVDQEIEDLLKRREFITKKLIKITKKQLNPEMKPKLIQLPERSIYVRTITAETQEETVLKIRRLAAGSYDTDGRSLFMIADSLDEGTITERWKECEAGLDTINSNLQLKQKILRGGTYATIQYCNTPEEYVRAAEALLHFIHDNGKSVCGPLIFKVEAMDTTTTKITDIEFEMQTLVV